MGNSGSSSAPPPTPTAAPPYPAYVPPANATSTLPSGSSADPKYQYWSSTTKDVDVGTTAGPNGMPAWPTDNRLMRYFSKATVPQHPQYMNMKKAYDDATQALKDLSASQDAWWMAHNTVHQANLAALGTIRATQIGAADADGQRMADEIAAAESDYKAQLDAYMAHIAANEAAGGEADAARAAAVATSDTPLCERMRAIKAHVDGSNARISGLLGRGFLENTGLSPPTTGAPDSCDI